MTTKQEKETIEADYEYVFGVLQDASLRLTEEEKSTLQPFLDGYSKGEYAFKALEPMSAAEIATQHNNFINDEKVAPILRKVLESGINPAENKEAVEPLRELASKVKDLATTPPSKAKAGEIAGDIKPVHYSKQTQQVIKMLRNGIDDDAGLAAIADVKLPANKAFSVKDRDSDKVIAALRRRDALVEQKADAKTIAAAESYLRATAREALAGARVTPLIAPERAQELARQLSDANTHMLHGKRTHNPGELAKATKQVRGILGELGVSIPNSESDPKSNLLTVMELKPGIGKKMQTQLQKVARDGHKWDSKHGEIATLAKEGYSPREIAKPPSILSKIFGAKTASL